MDLCGGGGKVRITKVWVVGQAMARLSEFPR